EGGALHYAVEHNRKEMAEWLLDHGANPFLQKANPYRKETPLEMGITHGDGRLAPRMLKEGQRHFQVPKADTQRADSQRRSQPKTLEEFLGIRGVALLSAAAQRGELEAVQALLDAGVSAKGNTNEGTSLLQEFGPAEAAASKQDGFDSARWLQ